MTTSTIINNPGPEIPIAGKETMLLRSIPSSKVRRISCMPILICSWQDQDICIFPFLGVSYLARYHSKYPTKLSAKTPRSLLSTASFSKSSQWIDCLFRSRSNTDVHRNADIHRNISSGILTSHPVSYSLGCTTFTSYAYLLDQVAFNSVCPLFSSRLHIKHC